MMTSQLFIRHGLAHHKTCALPILIKRFLQSTTTPKDNSVLQSTKINTHNLADASLQKRLVRHSGSSPKHSIVCHKLNHRGLVRVEGKDTFQFLQGLITNDMTFLSSEISLSMYAMFLNLQGRILYDVILYNIGSHDAPCVLIECDRTVDQDLVNHIKKFKIRKKVEISLVGGEHMAWSFLPEDSTVPATDIQLNFKDKAQAICATYDPRWKKFGWRMLFPCDVEGEAVVEDCRRTGDSEYYRSRRYMAGIAEGCSDMPPGASNPLESNATFQNGICFKKGCYIGQELTARTHHTGIIRKRLMPIKFLSETHSVTTGNSIENSAGKSAGRVRGVTKKHGLGLLRLAEALGKDDPLIIKAEEDRKAGEAVPVIPEWWQLDTDVYLQQILGKKGGKKK